MKREAWGRSPVPPDRIEAAARMPRGFYLLTNFAAPAEQEEITAWVAAHVSWSCGTSCGNRLETYVEAQESVSSLRSPSAPASARPLPGWGVALGRRMLEAGIFDEAPNYLHLIDYKPGGGIPPHVDREELGEVVAGLTLGSSRVFEFRREEDGDPEVRVLLCPGDLYVLSGAARHRWKHSVPFTTADQHRGKVYPRSRCLSASWRRFPHGPTWISDFAAGRR
jgi:alkylated DNA repair dioxygenase AlkB